MEGLITSLIINGLMNGILYGTVALGLTLVFGIMRVVNFAHGEFYMISAFITATFALILPLPYYVVIPVSLISIALISYVIYTGIIKWLIDKEHTAMLIATLGLSQFLMGITQVIWGAEPRNINSPLIESVSIGNIMITQQKIFSVILALLAICIILWMMKRTTMGKFMIAIAQDPLGGKVSGIDLNRVYAFGFIVSACLAGLMGATMGASTPVFAGVGQIIVIKAFIVIMLGGLDNIYGALIGGLMLGIVESVGGGLISVQYTDAFGYLLLIIMLIIRPNGLSLNSAR